MREGNIGREWALLYRYTHLPRRTAGWIFASRKNPSERLHFKDLKSISPPRRWKNHRLMVPNAAALRLGLGRPRIISHPLEKSGGRQTPLSYCQRPRKSNIIRKFSAGSFMGLTSRMNGMIILLPARKQGESYAGAGRRIHPFESGKRLAAFSLSGLTSDCARAMR